MPACVKVATSSDSREHGDKRSLVVTSLPVFSPFREHGGIGLYLPHVVSS